MANPNYPSGASVMFACADDTKAIFLSLLEDLGFDGIDAGGLKVARLLEPFGML